ncbi:PIG-L family deacetylase [Hymenobacter actinosclerus]|uniref:NPCBM-associated, NEW3 domain of alpha-galactosidase n=1 Tax=Hymenobacter actinosclerus TaxID=82805 RepID=A0A1I0GPG1_9BACT|nr:PIG-L family deacetylase [Hymenobacter actinosclerus]SET72044.1 NPCBM-associated, NEW3 domain of alpha-galactosidase [Hymenobacter actinosclerus]
MTLRCPLRAAALLLVLLTHSLLHAFTAQAQAPKTWSSGEILLGLKKLNVLGSALYIAAHPDDENTRLLAYLANGRLVETGYLSCTRGDGGQNLIGPELREGLGVIRTQELLAARRVDGGRQFFTRANDFGFSKTAQETFTIWDKEQVLADMVWVIRQRRPDVMITRFPPDARAGHGHHTASAMLAIEAFDAAADPKRFPEQLKSVQPWQARRLLWNTGSFFVKPGEDMSQYLSVDAGGYNPLLGRSYGEIAAESRTKHKSQGFGSAAQRGEAPEYFQLLKGAPAKTDLFDGVDLTWNRVPGGAAVGKLVNEVIRNYDASNPSASVAGLLKVREVLQKLQPVRGNYWKDEKLGEVNELIQYLLGLYAEAISGEKTVASGQLMTITLDVLKRTDISIQLVGIGQVNGQAKDSIFANPYPLDKPFRSVIRNWRMPEFVESTQPYWLREQGTVGMYAIPKFLPVASLPAGNGRVDVSQVIDETSAAKTGTGISRSSLIGVPENPNPATLTLLFRIGVESWRMSVPVQYKHTDPVRGEIYEPLTVVPPVMVNLGGQAFVFADQQPKTVPVTLRAGKAGVKGNVALTLPAGWQSEPASISFDLAAKDAEQTVQFQVRPGAGAKEGRAELRAVANVDGQAYSRGYQVIAYEHIPTQTLFPEATAPLVKLDLKRRGQQIGYLMGAGDEVPEALRQIGYTVTLLKPDELTDTNLRRFDAVVLGIRAYNTVEQLKTRQPALLKYVENGGNVVVQYVVNRGTVLPEIGPYPMTLGRDRVTVEGAPVTLLNPKQPLLNAPNRISPQDFTGWVQEQGLYYPEKWDPRYQTVISSHDPGETPKESAILVANYGKGHYIYTGLSLFRELPAGVPGAYRILTNMVSLGK